MSSSAVRVLQQEQLRLKNENETLRQDKDALYRYLDTITELYWATQKIATAKAPLQQLNQLLQQVMAVIEAGDGSLSRLDEAAGELVFVFAYGNLSKQLPGYRIKSEAGIAGWVVENREPIIVNNPRQDWRFSQEVDEEFHFFTRSIISVPVMRRDKFWGVIQLLNKRNGQFDQADVALLLMLGLVAAIAIEEYLARVESGQADKSAFYL